jgi:iron-sulfur cluster repair protein YtfE (RIC family)
MTTLTQPLRDEHKELYPDVEMLRLAAEAIKPDLSTFDRRLIDRAYDFLAHHLLPHAQAEEAALYPAVQQVMGAPSGTATMSRDHVEVERLTAELGALRDQVNGLSLAEDQVHALRRVLYGLYAVVKLHFAKEEEVYLPLLDAGLTPDDAAEMFAKMEEAAHHAREHLHA